MTTEIWLEGNKLDINKDLDALLTFNVDDIKDFSARNTNFSKTIVLPGTQNNNKLFNSIYEISQTTIYNASLDNININFNTNVSAKCIIFQNNIQIFKGTLKILQIVIDKDLIEYECAVFGELGNLIYALGTHKIEEIDFSDYDHTYDLTSIRGSWDYNGQYYYPLIDYGTYSINKLHWDIKTFRPAIYVKSYLDRIFNFVNYKKEALLFNAEWFTKLIIPFNQKVLNAYKLKQFENTAQYVNQTMNADELRPFAVQNDMGYFGNFTSSDNIGFTWTGGSTVLSLNYYSEFTYTFPSYSENYVTNSYINLLLNDGTSDIIIATSNTQHLYNGGHTWFTGYHFNTTFNINNGNRISFQLVVQGYEGYSAHLDLDFSMYSSTHTRINSAVPVLAPIEVGDPVTMNDCIPRNILMKDFLSSIMKMFNLYLYEDSIQNNIVIKPYIDFFDKDLANAKDWTYKLDMDKPITIKPMSEMNAKVYKFQYKKDNDYYNAEYEKRYNLTYGSFRFDTMQEFAQDEKNTDLIFSGTPIVGYDNTIYTKRYSTIFKRSGTTEECIDSNIRILQTKKFNVNMYNILDGPYTYPTYAYGYAGHFDDPYNPQFDINFGFPYELYYPIDDISLTANLFTVYWIAYMYEIIDADSRLMIGTFRLNEVDILQLDFSKFIYINGTLFRLNKIEDYDAITRNTCKVELIKVINVEY
jgi:hypothetical protein